MTNIGWELTSLTMLSFPAPRHAFIGETAVVIHTTGYYADRANKKVGLHATLRTQVIVSQTGSRFIELSPLFYFLRLSDCAPTYIPICLLHIKSLPNLSIPSHTHLLIQDDNPVPVGEGDT